MSVMRVTLVASSLALVGRIACPPRVDAAADAWKIQIAADGQEAFLSSIRWNPVDQRLAVAVSGDSLRYAAFDGTRWAGENVDDSVCSTAVSLGFDPGGEPA